MPLEQLGPYRVTRLLGRGGMGAVYEGVHVETGERAAVKILSIGHADDAPFRARFVSEIESLKLLQHPNIVRLIGYGEQDGMLFYSMELVAGKNLHEELQTGRRFAWREVSDIAVQICGALKHAHDHGVIHRDLKPANLLRTSEGTVKLTDFGIAKLFGSTQLTSAGGVIGTADYMAPEQAEGQGVTTRSDLYSLGSVMFALLVGQPPFPGKTVSDVLQRMKSLQPPPLRNFNPNIPQELQDIIEQLLKKNPADRIPTPLVLSKRLKAMLHGLAHDTQVVGDGDDDLPTSGGEVASDGGTKELLPQPWKEASWNQETRVTDSQAGQAGQPQQPQAATPTVQTQTHFTTVEQERSRTEVTDTASAEAPGERARHRIFSVAGILTALAGLACGVWYFSRPPSADTLYRTIQEDVSISERGDYMEVRREIDKFLQLYEDDPRAADVAIWRGDHNAYRAWKRLEVKARKQGGASYLSELEQEFLEAMRTAAVDPDAAREKHLALIKKLQAADPLTEDEREFLEAARHEINRL